MSVRVAVLTGGSSGIGLALAQHLLSKGWHVVIADINKPPTSANLSPESTRYIQCDVSSWKSQSSMFQQAFDWHQRIDFAALNAGIDDRDDIFDSIDTSTPPRKPNMATFKINLLAVYYGIKLSAHYMSRNPLPGGQIVITASSAGLYALPAIPQYVATKHALVGLTRALAPKAIARGIRLNALCPSMVNTNLPPPGLMDHFDQTQATPMSTMMRAYDELMDVREKKNGCVVEVAVNNLFYRDEIPHASQSQKRMSKGTLEVWDRVYRERNVKFANQDWKAEKRKRKEGNSKL
jgi:15-hydroxyprostaglandin dehydrogenase (NAD)